MKSLGIISFLSAALFLFAGCSSTPYDYTNFHAHPPRSIVVFPPINHSTDMNGTYGYLSTVTRPLAEMGFYVFPVAEIDEFMKENGMPTAGEMQQAPLDKIHSILGADAVLYLTLDKYGTKYEVITSSTTVTAHAKLVDVKSGMTIWEGTTTVQENTSSDNPIADLIVAAVDQIINSSTDHAHQLSGPANYQLLTTKDHGLLYGPYHPQSKQ
jgi:hypothetical protein